MTEIVAKLVSTAWELARIQVEGVTDYIGFSNADKYVGAHLAAIVEAEPQNTDAVKALATLVGVTYQRQVRDLVGFATAQEFKALSDGPKLTKEQRDTARATVIAQPDGDRVLFSFQTNPTFGTALQRHGGRASKGPDGWQWVIKAQNVADAVEDLKSIGARIVGSYEVAVPESVGKPKLVVVKPKDPTITVAPELMAKATYDHQKTGIAFLVQPLDDIRAATYGGHSIRGLIQADKMGLGKTMQTAIASKSIIDTLTPIRDSLKAFFGRILVISPSSYKLGWAREIHKFCGKQETIHILEGRNNETKIGPNPDARWNIVNYDILQDHYEEIVRMGFDILIIDEAHRIKNEDAERSCLVVGGKAKLAERFKQEQLKGLCAHATYRVFPLTGTPLNNRPKDLCNLLKAIGHPIARNRREFKMRYCDAQASDFRGTVFNGKSNLGELRERIDSVFLQRFEVAGLPPLIWNWIPVEVDTNAYREVMERYHERRANGELASTVSHLAELSEARFCTAVSKVSATIERIEDVLESDQKVIVFSNYTECIDKFKAHFGDAAVVLDGRITGNAKQRSAKRQEIQDRFNQDPNVKVFIGQTIAAGEAITLTAATYVIFNDLDWVPGNLLQAAKRPHRIGQTRTVYVELIVAAGTFDEHLMAMLEDKIDDNNQFEDTEFSLFPFLIERLRDEAPRNEEAKKLRRRVG